MYFILGFFILLAIAFSLLTHWRICRIRKKVCTLTPCEKSSLINELISSFGFSYLSGKDIFTSRLDAWQREFGYQEIYDRAAPHAQMIFQCEPVYFEAHDVTWLIEFWKGQYGINTGAEIGVYHSDSLIKPENYNSTRFHAVEDSLSPCISMELWKKETLLLRLGRRHWWLTGFLIGVFSNPEELALKASITFQDYGIAAAFAEALRTKQYLNDSLQICDTTVSFTFKEPTSKQPCEYSPLTCRFSQWRNRQFCKLYLWTTKPFCRSDDRLLYLYYFLPFAFRRTVRVCNPRRYKAHRRKVLRSKSWRYT